MAEAATMRFLDVWYTRFDADQLIAKAAAADNKRAVKAAKKALAKAQKRTSLGSLAKLRGAGQRRLPDQAAATRDRPAALDSADVRLPGRSSLYA